LLFAAYKVWKYADPIGAIVICIYILVSWFHMGCGELNFIVSLSWCIILSRESAPHFVPFTLWIKFQKTIFMDVWKAWRVLKLN